VWKQDVPLYRFGFHWYPRFLEDVAWAARPEPWGTGMKTLELYLRANYEIAKSQSRVYEDRSRGIAFWRAGSLVSATSDPLWMLYDRNRHRDPFWHFRQVLVGRPPELTDPDDLSLEYRPPEFHRDWLIHFQQGSLEHMLGDGPNRERLQTVLQQALGRFSEHLVLRAIYGEIQMKRKEEAVIPQWYHGDYQFLMPLHLTQPERVELTAALQPDPAMRRYIVRTLLLPHHAYAYARSVVKTRDAVPDWMLLSERELSQPSVGGTERDARSDGYPNDPSSAP
jgi:hypothetical protein